MNFKIKRTSFIPASIDTVWSRLTDHRFERDVLPEISRKVTAKPTVTETKSKKSVDWKNDGETNIELTQKELNVTIDAIRFSVKPCSGGVHATLCVDYSKPLEKHFIQAHCDTRQLFADKMRALVSDCIELSAELDYLPTF